MEEWGRARSLPRRPLCTQAGSVTHITVAEVWDFHREVFNLQWGLASHTAQTKPPTYSRAPAPPTYSYIISPHTQDRRKQCEPHSLSCQAEFKNIQCSVQSSTEQNHVLLYQRALSSLEVYVSRSLLIFFFLPFLGALRLQALPCLSSSLKEP